MTDVLLTDTDERILQWRHEGRPDAEIAVRLGMTVGEAKERIKKLKTKVAIDDDISRWRRPRPTEPVIDYVVIDATGWPRAAATSTRGAAGEYSARALVLAWLAGAGLSGLAVAGGWFLRGVVGA